MVADMRNGYDPIIVIEVYMCMHNPCALVGLAIQVFFIFWLHRANILPNSFNASPMITLSPFFSFSYSTVKPAETKTPLKACRFDLDFITQLKQPAGIIPDTDAAGVVVVCCCLLLFVVVIVVVVV
jgi:uncharacterized membrane protein YkgB